MRAPCEESRLQRVERRGGEEGETAERASWDGERGHGGKKPKVDIGEEQSGTCPRRAAARSIDVTMRADNHVSL